MFFSLVFSLLVVVKYIFFNRHFLFMLEWIKLIDVVYLLVFLLYTYRHMCTRIQTQIDLIEIADDIS